MNKLRKIDIPLTIVFSLLVIIGLIMVYSASNVVALYKYNDEFYFFKRELIFGLVGTFIMILIINMNVSKIYKMTTIIFIIGVALLILVLIPGIGIIRGGARSWIGFGSFSIQPAEFSKIVLVLLLSKYLSQTKEEINSFFNFLEHSLNFSV